MVTTLAFNELKVEFSIECVFLSKVGLWQKLDSLLKKKLTSSSTTSKEDILDNRGNNILKCCNILGQGRFATSKAGLDMKHNKLCI